MKPGWMMTHTGRVIYPLEFKPEDVCIEDIAHHLAFQCRYAGATVRHYSVAEHAVYVSQNVAPEDAKEALLHDAAEAYIQDILMGLKHTEIMLPFRELEDRVEATIYQVFGVHPTSESKARIKAVDTRIVMDETLELMPNHHHYWAPRAAVGVAPLKIHIAGYTPRVAKLLFMERYFHLFGEPGGE